MIDLRHGDCRTVLSDVTPDVMIIDPPYSEHVHASAMSCGTPGAFKGEARKKPLGAHARDLGFSHLGDELRVFICALAARTRRWSVIFTDTESVGLWKDGLEVAGATYVRSVPWVRWSMPQLSGDRPPQGHEMVVLAWGAAKGKKSWNGPGNLTHFAHTCMRGKNKHKAQKPLDLVLDLVEFFSNSGEGATDDAGESYRRELNRLKYGGPGELIVDPCMGSGTTAMACAVLGRNFIGCEQDQSWVEKAKRRLHADELWYDDEERYAKYLVASKARQEDMARMARNTARIVANRKAQTDG